ncbi:Lipoprotein [Lactobacillus delbrueckii subsp. bulgaricus 2038]|nr:Lipoprotein [Lactobacillus delbrueckii subsp. bulgaricus 2038]
MKKNRKNLALLLLAASLLAGCAGQSNSQSSQSNQAKSEKKEESKASSKSAAKSAASSAVSSSAVSSTKSSSSRASSKSAASSSQRADANRMGTLTSQLRVKLPGMLLPAADGLGQGSSNLNIRYTSSSSQNVVYYSVGNSPLALNDSRIASEKPYAVLTENKNVADASSLINYQEPKTGLPAVKIAGNVTGTEEGAAGSTYLQFNQGQWSFVVRASNVQGQKPLPTAQKLLALYQQYGLPDTAAKSSVQVDVGESLGSLNTVITWAKGSSVYQLKAHSTETAFKMLKSLN